MDRWIVDPLAERTADHRRRDPLVEVTRMMARPLLRLWIAAVVCATLASVVWLSTAPAVSRAAAVGGLRRMIAVGSLPWADVERITVRRGAGSVIEFVRRGGHWWQSKPFEYPMQDAEVDGLLARAAEVQVRDGTTGADVVDATVVTGLTADAPTVEFRWASGGLTLRLGARLPAGFAWMCSDADPQPKVARSTFHDAALLGDFRQWRTPFLFSRADVECTRLVCEQRAKGGVERIEVVREGPRWRLVSPLNTRADRGAVERWLEALERAQTSGFVADNPAELLPFGLDRPSSAVEVHSERQSIAVDGTVHRTDQMERLEIGSPVRSGAAERFARLTNRPEAVLEIDATAVAAAVPIGLLLVDPTATGCRAEDIAALRVDPVGGEQWRLQRMAGEWKVVSAQGEAAADKAAAESLLAKLCTSRAAEVTLERPSAELVAGRIVAESFDGRDIAALAIVQERNNGRFGIDDGSGVLRIHPSSLALRLDSASCLPAAPQATPVPQPMPQSR
ncbi:MAG: DUF4340 domain-containing protein [Planctomycetes bacterium]|nr:DUF4340 domain-containing protein [Planctomycetota bacterium]